MVQGSQSIITSPVQLNETGAQTMEQFFLPDLQALLPLATPALSLGVSQ